MLYACMKLYCNSMPLGVRRAYYGNFRVSLSVAQLGGPHSP